MAFTNRPEERFNERVCRLFIKQNFLKMSDKEMAKQLRYPEREVAQTRRRLGLKRPRRPAPNSLKTQLNPQQLEWLLTRGGRQPIELAKTIGITRERMRQIIEELHLNTKREPLWYAIRWGLPELGDKKFFELLIKKYKGVKRLANELKISEYNILALAHKLEIYPELLSCRAPTIRLR